MPATATPPALDQLWSWLEEVPDPEIPVLSICDLGIVREVLWSETEPGLCVVTITPTYSGCPATEVIAQSIREQLAAHGLEKVKVRTRLSPAWTTDWLTEEGRDRLRRFGIAPPGLRADAGALFPLSRLLSPQPPTPACPRCGSGKTETVSAFGSTPCKSLHRCLACLEPFDYFKSH